MLTVNASKANPYVSRGGLKLESVTKTLDLDFKNKVVLDVGSSTGGFTDYALKHRAKKVIAVDSGTNQLHVSLRNNPSIELHEKTDIKDFTPKQTPDIILIDVSFISITEILPHIKNLCGPETVVIAMVKPQFETREEALKNRGVIKNEKMRRQVLKEFENWVQKIFKIIDKADSRVPGQSGNLERFYKLKRL